MKRYDELERPSRFGNWVRLKDPDFRLWIVLGYARTNGGHKIHHAIIKASTEAEAVGIFTLDFPGYQIGECNEITTDVKSWLFE